MLDTLTAEMFAGRIGERFRFRANADAAMDVELINATVLGSPSAVDPGRRKPFSILFRGPLTPVWQQRIYRVEHDGMGSFELFIVPVGPKNGGMEYEAVFT
jgi:hypothetical protein